MDPNQAWSALWTAVEDGDWDRVTEVAEGLLQWLEKGGFPPTITGNPKRDKLMAEMTCSVLSEWEVV